jgi:uncharacterized protein YggE
MARGHRLTALVAVVVLLLAGAAGALLLVDRDGGGGPQTALAQERFEERGISVEGEGRVYVTPDVAYIILGVEVEGVDLEELRQDADGRMNDVTDSLLDMGFEEGDLRTIAYDIQVVREPEDPFWPMDEPAVEEEPEIDDRDDAVTDDDDDAVTDDDDDAVTDDDDDAVTEDDDDATDDNDVTDDPIDEAEDPELAPETAIQTFRIVQLLQVRVTDIDSAGEVIDTALEAGANRVAGVSFEVEDRQDAVEQAREQAVEEARQKAEHLAELTGVSLGEPLRINEWSPSGPPMRMEEAAMEMDVAEDAGMPRIQPGEQTISVLVDIIYAID